jgi:dienelactone hydrolase
MAEMLLFHHAQGLTSGVVGFADRLRDAGHTVHTPDLYDGHTFATLDDGIAYAKEQGFGNLMEAGTRTAEGLPDDLVYAGFSLGVMPAQALAETRSGSRGALFFHACLPVDEFAPTWPTGVPVQIHAKDGDPLFVEDGDLDAARQLVASAGEAELFLYPGKDHLFADPSLSSYDASAAELMTGRVLTFLAACDGRGKA